MEQSHVFETFTVSRSELMDRPSVLSKIKSLLDRTDIKVVDVKRNHDELTIVFRRLS
ncbi:MAG: hypothetical protein K6T83_04885 [Alicyclobacillus sp.]|nr:hypothetical protein [Alicyclobacillus sp.]